MATRRLTARTLDSIQPPREGRIELFDEDLPGFCVRITASGHRTACVFYRSGRRLRRATIGSMPPLTLADARDLARIALRDAALGEDPAGDKREARDALTMAGLVRDYIEAGAGTRSATTNGDYGRMLRAVIAPASLGRTPATAVKRAHLRAFLEEIARSAPIRANRILALVRAAYRWGQREDIIEVDPTVAVRRPRPERPRERVLSDDEIKRLWTALDGLTAGATEGDDLPGRGAVIAAAVRLLLLVGTRKSETLNMRWADLDERAQTWTVPGRFRKGGRTHVVPLPPLALQILAEVRSVTSDGPWVFAGQRGASLANNPHRLMVALRKASGIEFGLHDLRRTCATGCARLVASESTVSRILGHKAIAGTIAVSGIYDRFDRLPEVRAALAAWSHYVSDLVSGDSRGEVVPFAARG